MTGISSWQGKICAVFLGLALFSFAPQVFAADSLTVSVTPPLVQLSIGPGEFWASTLKIINSNEYDVTYFAEVVNFENTGENGRGTFLPLIEEFDGTPADEHTLARWISLPPDPITVPRGGSVDVPYSVRVPMDADPGGHYAAVLIGTQPIDEVPQSGSLVSVSSYVSSLFFVRVKGEVIEKGRIREFVTEKSLYESPNGKFVLRFENLGTVHLQPQGTITIYNMWGKERGKVFVNEKTNFGNVLPASVRRFEFDWSGEYSPFDIGQYSAVVTLAYGDEAKQNVSATTYFWVVPVVPVAGTAAGFIFIVGCVTFFIRRYIRRVLELERARVREMHVGGEPNHAPQLTLQSMTLPLREGVVDLRTVSSGQTDRGSVLSSEALVTGAPLDTRGFFTKYRLFFVALPLFTVFFIVAVWYFGEALTSKRTFEITNVQVEEDLAQ